MNVPPATRDQIELAQETRKKLEWDAKHQESKKEESQHVVVTDIDIPISDLVVILLKLAIAAVPAAIIFGIIWVFVAMVFFRSL